MQSTPGTPCQRCARTDASYEQRAGPLALPSLHRASQHAPGPPQDAPAPAPHTAASERVATSQPQRAATATGTTNTTTTNTGTTNTFNVKVNDTVGVGGVRDVDGVRLSELDDTHSSVTRAHPRARTRVADRERRSDDAATAPPRADDLEPSRTSTQQESRVDHLESPLPGPARPDKHQAADLLELLSQQGLAPSAST